MLAALELERRAPAVGRVSCTGGFLEPSVFGCAVLRPIAEQLLRELRGAQELGPIFRERPLTGELLAAQTSASLECARNTSW